MFNVNDTLAELYRKPLTAFCKMVLNPVHYTFQALDFQYLLSDYDNLKQHLDHLRMKKKKPKGEIQMSADIVEARKMAQNFLQHLDSHHDFAFQGQSFYDPLEIFNWANVNLNGNKATSADSGSHQAKPQPMQSDERNQEAEDSDLTSLEE
jgi:hypothetical protein